MTKLVYRGVAYDTEQNKPEQQRVYRRPHLVYRGVEHNGVRTIETKKHGFTGKLIYRGQEFA